MDLVRVLTLNIWNRQGPWEQRLALIRDGIRELAPDVIGLQEVLHHDGKSQAHAIAEGFGYEVAFGKAHDLGGGVEFGNAVLSRWPILKTDVSPLPTGGTREARSVLFAELASPHGTLPFFVTHFNWKFHEGVVREEQALEVARLLKHKAPIAGLPPILVGDLNAQPEATEIRFLKGLHALSGKSMFLDDAFEHAGEGEGYTFDAQRNPFAALTHEYPRRIDYVLVRGPDKHGRGKPVHARVVLEEVVDGIAASDHYGVYAEIRM